MSNSATRLLAAFISLYGACLCIQDVHAMTLEQLKALEGTALLEMRVNELFQHCGLPSIIADTADVSQHQQLVQWEDVEMKLSSMAWEITYSRKQNLANHKEGWTNPGNGSVACLTNLSDLVVHAKGDVGFLAVKKRADNNGYTTSYNIPKDLYVAHQVIGLSGRWKKEVPISRLLGQYGNPDEILTTDKKVTKYRYWVLTKEKDMPASLYAVDFEFRDGEENCYQFVVQTNGSEFVQERLDILLRQWEASYMD